VAGRLVAEHPEIGAIVLECTNMPPYRADIQAATGLPSSTSPRWSAWCTSRCATASGRVPPDPPAA